MRILHSRSLVTLLVFCALGMVFSQTAAAPVANYTVTVTTEGNGTVTKTPNKASYGYGEVVKLTAVANPGSRFVSWTGDLNQQDWWDTKYDYRIPLTVDADGYQRTDKPAEVDLNFTSILAGLGSSQPFELKSLRLVEVNSSGVVTNQQVPFQFDQAPGFNASSNAAGTLIFLLLGSTGAATERQYMLYFDVQGKSFTPATVTPLVTLTDGVTDEGWASLKMETSSATYFFHKQGGGFSSVNDTGGHDWVNFSSATASAGNYRGIPNMVYTPSGGYFHPGRDVATTEIVSQGPLKVTFRTKVTGLEWQTLWSVYPTYATMTVEKAAGSYWFLYEGTPGGKLDLTTDFVTRSNGMQTAASDSWEGDLSGDEWVYFADPGLDRSLFMAHHEADGAVDSYRPQNDNPGNEEAAMTVFGFGRKLATTNSFLTGTTNHLTFGLLEGTVFGANETAILSAVEPLQVSTGTGEKRQTVQEITASSFDLRVTGDHQITATFAPEGYVLAVEKVGNGTVTRDPDKATYAYGEKVALQAIPDAGWSFAGWSDSLGDNPNLELTMTEDRSVTATFTQDEYTLDMQILGQGTVQVDPQKDTYHLGDKVDLTAVPATDWKFVRWEGAISSTKPSRRLTIAGDTAVTAIFAQKSVKIDLYLPTIISGK